MVNSKIKKIRNFIALIMCIGIILSLSSCDNSDKKDGKNQDSNINVEHTIETEKDSENANTSDFAPAYGGSIAIFSYKPDTLCPILTNNNANMHMLNIVYDGLVDIERDMSLSPSLAESWNISDDAKTFTITLRNNVFWHDGSSFTGDDVKYTIDQIKLNKDSYYVNNVSNISSVKVQGLSLEIRLREENSEFMRLMSFPIIKKQTGNVSKEGFIPNGTGAFRYEDRNEGNMYHLVRNDSWWNGKAYLDEVTVKLLPDKDTALYSFSSGAIQLAPSENSDWGRFIDSTSDSYFGIPTNKFTFVGINNTNNVLKRDEVRQAISLVINRDEIVSDILMSNGSTASTPISRNSYLFDSENGYKDRNTDEALKCLTDNGWEYKDGCFELRERTKVYKLKFEILINEENAVREQIASAVSKQLNEFGIKTEIKKVSFENYEKQINSKKYDLFIGTYKLSEDNDFRFMFEKGNIFGFSDDDINETMRNIRLSVTEDGKKQAYSSFQKLFNVKNPIIGICFENDVMLYKTTLDGQLSSVYNDIYKDLDKIYIK